MKKTTLWKVTAALLLIAVCLPLFPKAVPPTEAVAVTTVAPLPYAMERYGQHHSGIYSAKEAVVLDGKLDASYNLMDSYDDQAGNFDGVFCSGNTDGTDITEPATEFVPDIMEIRGTYDDTYVYLLVSNLSRTNPNGYALTCNFGFNFGETQINAQESRKTISLAIGANEGSVSDENSFVTTATEKNSFTDSTGTYEQNTTVFEFRVPWADIAPEGQTPEESFQKMYLTLCYTFYDGGKDMYRIYGVPNSVTLPSGATVGTAFGEGAGTFTPNVVHLLGEKGGFTSAPTIEEVERTDKNTTKDRTFRATLSLTDVEKTDVKEAGVIFTADASTLATVNPVWTADGANVFKTAESTGETVLNFKVSFGTAEADYEKFFSIRPYILYSDDSIVYGASYSNTPAYFDAETPEWKARYNLLMIGSSYCTYYLDEMMNIAMADNVYLQVVRAYKSGATAYEHWTFLVNDFKSTEDEVIHRRVYSPDIPKGQNRGYFTDKEILAFADWDFISFQDGYKGNEYTGVYRDGYSVSYPHPGDAVDAAMNIQKMFRYLQRYHPDAELYIHHTWSRQVGYGYKNDTVVLNEDGSVKSGVVKSGYEDRLSRIETLEEQKHLHEIQCYAAETVSELTGIPRIPTGPAWMIARANPVIGDTLCNRSTGTDYYHDGDIGGGQYLNAAVYYEVLTGNDVRGNTWRPSYDLPEEKIIALQNAAHEAVVAVYGEDHFTR